MFWTQTKSDETKGIEDIKRQWWETVTKPMKNITKTTRNQTETKLKQVLKRQEITC